MRFMIYLLTNVSNIILIMLYKLCFIYFLGQQKSIPLKKLYLNITNQQFKKYFHLIQLAIFQLVRINFIRFILSIY